MNKKKKKGHKSHRTELQAYISLFYQDNFKDEVTAAFETAKAVDPKAKRIDVLTRFAQERYANETPEVKLKVRAHVDDMRKKDAARNALSPDDGVPEDAGELKTWVQWQSPGASMLLTHIPFSRIDALPSYLQCVLDRLNMLTGFKFSVYCGGYDETGDIAMYRYVIMICMILLLFCLVVFIPAPAKALRPQHLARFQDVDLMTCFYQNSRSFLRIEVCLLRKLS